MGVIDPAWIDANPQALLRLPSRASRARGHRRRSLSAPG